MKDLLIVVVNYNTTDLTLSCIRSIYKHLKDVEFDIAVVDNGSSDRELIKSIKRDFQKVFLIASDKNHGFAGGNNLAIRKYYKNYKYILLLNSDTEVEDNSINLLLSNADEKKAGIASCKLHYKGGEFQPNAGYIPSTLPLSSWLTGIDDIFRLVGIHIPSYQERSANFYREDKKVGWVSGSVMLIKNDVIEKVGLLDEKIFMYGEDVEYCMRANKEGFGVWWFSKPNIMHIGGGSSNAPKFSQWLGEFKGLIYIYEKYYSRNLASILRYKLKFFVAVRAVAFLLLGKKEYGVNYLKIYGKI